MNWNDVNMIEKIKIKIYEPAYGIICDPHKKNPQTRQSADHSMLYILSTLLRKALESDGLFNDVHNMNDLWKKLILMPDDYSFEAIRNERTRELMEKIELEYGGEEFD
ncbi:MAG: hypothetical protein DHS20C13_30560 [Thermodesulfobacteriota bacterium]|nr:MAG: hypothetical protein DHS20C13_30560 [Thermodesulfobacteriota bacterium]